MKKLFKKLDDLIFKLVDYEEEKKYEKKIKECCRKNRVNKKILLKYINLNKEIYLEVNKVPSFGEEIIHLDLEIAMEQILNRIYELNKEFLSAIKEDYFNTTNALTRQIIELFLIVFQISLDKDYACVLTGNYQNHKGFPSFKQIISKLNKNQIKIEKDYEHYSGNFHPKKDSFMRNLFLLSPDFTGNVIIPFGTKLKKSDLSKLRKFDYGFAKPYYGNKDLMKQGWKLGTFTKNSAGVNRRRLINDFMFYIESILRIYQ